MGKDGLTIRLNMLMPNGMFRPGAHVGTLRMATRGTG